MLMRRPSHASRSLCRRASARSHRRSAPAARRSHSCLEDSLRLSAVLCVLCVYWRSSTQRTQRAAENRREITMNADATINIGATHALCQDYVIAKDRHVILSDGCSSSPDTDIGARLLVKALEQNLSKSAGIEALH